MNPFKDPLLEIRADGLVAVLAFEVVTTSALTKQFTKELVQALTASTKKQPIVYRSDRGVVIVYRAAEHIGHLNNEYGRTLDYSGRCFSDGPRGLNGSIGLSVTTDVIELPEGGRWAGDKTPESTPRFTLPVFDADATALALVALFDKWTDVGHIIEIARPPRVGWRPDVSYETKLRDPNSLDPTDPARLIPGALDELRTRWAQASDEDRARVRER